MQFCRDGTTVSLGDYVNEEDAARAFDEARIHQNKSEPLNRLQLNFPFDSYQDDLKRIKGTLLCVPLAVVGHSNSVIIERLDSAQLSNDTMSNVSCFNVTRRTAGSFFCRLELGGTP